MAKVIQLALKKWMVLLPLGAVLLLLAYVMAVTVPLDTDICSHMSLSNADIGDHRIFLDNTGQRCIRVETNGVLQGFHVITMIALIFGSIVSFIAAVLIWFND